MILIVIIITIIIIANIIITIEWKPATDTSGPRDEAALAETRNG